jgi:hypothetical protein
MVFRQFLSIVFCVPLSLLAWVTVLRADESWRYVVPPAGAEQDHPPLRALALSRDKPADLRETAHYRGRHRYYTQIRYGNPRSTEVAVVVDEISSREIDLYVDADRNRLIEDKDRVPGTGPWRVKIDAALVEGKQLNLFRRTVIFEYGAVSRTIRYATCGFVEGKTAFEGRAVSVRRVDGDGNGLFSDPTDRLWIDLNDDGKWDPLTEQFLFAPVLRLQGTRYIVRSDAAGSRLSLQKLEGTGTIELQVENPKTAEAIIELSACLVGRDGSVVSIQGNKAQQTVPVGDYRLSTLAITLMDSSGAEPWHFLFSDTDDRAAWHAVARDHLCSIDPIGQLELKPGLKGRTYRPGNDINLQPALFTGSGLLINSAYRGQQAGFGGYGGPGALISLCESGGNQLSTAFSGFA